MSEPLVRHTGTAIRAVWGDGALGTVPDELRRLGVKRAIAVCGRSIAASPDIMGLVQEHLGDSLVATFTGVREHSPLPEVLAAVELMDEVGADAVVAIGGGSAVVTARAATILHAERRDVRDLATHLDPSGRLVSPRLSAPKVPNIVLATTPTTAYAKAGAAVRDPDQGERLALFDPKARARVVVFDPVLARTAPTSLVRSASLNVLSMAVDGMQSVDDNPLAEALLRQALRETLGGLPALADQGGTDRVRLRLMLAALLAGQGSDSAGTGIAQALSHALGPISGVANGIVEAMLLPHTADFNREVTRQSQVGIAEEFSRPGNGRDDLSGLLSGYLASLALPPTLSAIGVSREQLPAVVAHALEDWSLTRVPKKASPDDLRQILEAAL